MSIPADTVAVFCCDQNYFPLAKGLVLSIVGKAPLPDGVRLAFLDLGCDEGARQWFAARGVDVLAVSRETMGWFSDPALGYQRSQACRPFLPELFPDADAFIWMDCDAWLQDPSVLGLLRSLVIEDKEALVIAPECHYSYSAINDDAAERRREMFSYYEPTFGAAVAEKMCERMTLNSGIFACAAGSPVWSDWKREVERLYVRECAKFQPIVRHMAEQIALNVIVSRGLRVTLLDPLYNYLCLWTRPVRDADGVVRVALPPHAPIGIVHLAGGWRDRGREYFEAGLLYDGGAYLSQEDVKLLFPGSRIASFR